MKQVDSDLLDWENVLWFMVAHKLRVTDVRIKGMDELRSEVGTFDGELTALTDSYIDLYNQKRSFHQHWEQSGKKAPYADDPKWKILCKQMDRAIEAFKERICNTP